MKAKTAQKALKKHLLLFGLSLTTTVLLLLFCCSMPAHAAAPSVSINLSAGEAEGAMGPLELLFLFAILALAPSILIMMTSCTRIVIVLSFLRNALGVQQTPPNQVIVGLALFLTLFVMSPVFGQINEQAYIPYRDGTITQEAAVENAVKPLKIFMLRQTQSKDLNLFLSISGQEENVEPVSDLDELADQLGLEIVVPSFLTSELKRAFTMGFLLFIPFLIIDMVVSSTLMSMGMVMLPPSMIALPFKIMLFVLVDGWNLLLGTLASSFFT